MDDRTITLYDRINLAHCAMRRGEAVIRDEKRFHGEYETARAWTHYRIYNSPNCQFVETL